MVGFWWWRNRQNGRGTVKIEVPTVKIEVPTVKIARLGGSKKPVFFDHNRCRGNRQNGILNRQNGILNRQNGNGGTKTPSKGNPLSGFTDVGESTNWIQVSRAIFRAPNTAQEAPG